MKYYIKIFGCQMNYSDAERISTILEKYKFKPAASIEAASLIVFVTCGVRQMAEDRVYGQIHNIRKKYPRKKIILTGCLAHRKDVQRRLKGKANIFTSIKDFPKSLALRNPDVTSGGEKPSFGQNNYLQIIPKYTNSYTAYIPIMTGCNNFCSYCVVPYARGREYSRPAEDILKEIKSLIKKGYKEIILLGQNVNSYCHPERSEGPREKILPSCDGIPRSARNDSSVNFPHLLRLIEKIPGNFWLTFLTSHPKDMSDELIETIANSEKICEYISLPAQSGDNEILKKMNRHYTIAHYKNLIKKIRQKSLALGNPDVTSGGEKPSFDRKSLAFEKKLSKFPPAVSTDIIVGFPGETKKQFEKTAKLLREMKFDMAYISQYSPRPGTAAWKLKDNVSKKEKVRREKVLTKILEKTALENNKKYVGKVVEVLVDKKLSSKLSFEESRLSREAGGKSLALEPYKYISHTRTQKKVIFISNKKIPIGSFQKVKIIKAKAFGLEGKLLLENT